MGKWHVIHLIGLLLCSGYTQAQTCPNGIPSAGNPGCIPPDQANSPYYNSGNGFSGSYQSPAPIVRKQKWADRWGAIAMDEFQPIMGASSGLKSERLAKKQALQECKSQGGKACKLSIAYQNQCVALLAKKGGGAVTSRSPTINQAIDNGNKLCKQDGVDCKVYYTNCSMSEEYWVKQ